MRSIRLTQPESEPVSVSDMKAHLNITFNDDDELLSGMISAARDFAERYCNRVWAEAEFALLGAAFPAVVRLPYDTLTVSAITYKDTGGAEQSLQTADFVVNTEQRTIRPAPGGAWPSGAYDVRVAITEGQGGSPPMVPDAVIMAIKLLAGDFYANREGSIVGVSYEPNPAVTALLFSHRVDMGV